MQEDANREVAPEDSRVVTSSSQAHRAGRSAQMMVWGAAGLVLLLIAVWLS
jgi:hypothetical protein